MSGRFLVFGVIVSVVVHALILFALSAAAPSEPAPPESAPPEPVRDKIATESPAQEPLPSSLPSPVAHPTPSRPPARPVTLPTAHPASAREPAPTPEIEWVTYTVRKGDMLERLAKRAGCSVSEIVRYNKTTYGKLEKLKAGQRIKLPKFKNP